MFVRKMIDISFKNLFKFIYITLVISKQMIKQRLEMLSLKYKDV